MTRSAIPDAGNVPIVPSTRAWSRTRGLVGAALRLRDGRVDVLLGEVDERSDPSARSSSVISVSCRAPFSLRSGVSGCSVTRYARKSSRVSFGWSRYQR